MLMDVMETGDYQSDYEAGRRVAARFVERLQECEVTPFYLSDLAEGFKARYGPVEYGFMTEISYRLMQI